MLVHSYSHLPSGLTKPFCPIVAKLSSFVAVFPTSFPDDGDYFLAKLVRWEGGGEAGPIFFLVRRGSSVNLFRWSTVCTEAYLTLSHSWQLECQLGTTSKWSLLCMYTWFYETHLLNISCLMGPCVPPVMTCLGCPSPLSSRFYPTIAASTHIIHPRAPFPAHTDLV